MSEPMNIEFDDRTVVDRETTPALGPRNLLLPEGEAHCHDSISVTSITAEDEDGMFIVIITVADFYGLHLGTLTRMSPDSARNFAASLIAAANEIDGGHANA